MKIKKYIKAFTLIELLVVISIIGILATLVSANLNAARSRARDAVRKADLKNIQTALRIYYNDSSSYPIAGGVPFGSEWASGTTTYMKLVPDDPLAPEVHYAYTPDAVNDSYQLQACLENESDAICDSEGGAGIDQITCATGCSITFTP